MAKADSPERKTTGEPQKSSGSKSSKGGQKASTKPNLFARLGQYFRDVRSEMRRVVWPGGTEVRNSSLVVLVTLLFFVAFTFIVDNVVIYLIKIIAELG